MTTRKFITIKEVVKEYKKRKKLMNDPFIKKHLEIIKDMTLQAKQIREAKNNK